MEISRMLLKFKASQLQEGFEKLETVLRGNQEDEARELRIILHVKLEELELLNAAIDRSEDVTSQGNTDIAETLHKLKHDYHAVHRRWQALCPRDERRNIDIAA